MIHIVLLLLLVLSQPSPCLALDATSVQPSTVEPGGMVTLTGGPFTSQTRVILGNHELLPESIQSGRLLVRIPSSISSGDYVIFLAEGAQSSQQAFILHLRESRPVIEELSPEQIDVCRTPGTTLDLHVAGRGFLKGARVLLDGAVIGPASPGGDTLVVELPPLEVGNHKIQIINPAGSKSIPHNIIASDQPSINNISVGEDQVNSYQLIIDGRNFSPHSKLLVNGTLIAPADSFLFHQKDSLTYVDCATLHYNRYQTTGQLQRVRFRVLNPSGRQSEVYGATIR